MYQRLVMHLAVPEPLEARLRLRAVPEALNRSVNRFPDNHAHGSASILQGLSNLAARGVTCACHAHVHEATTRVVSHP